MRDSYVIPEFRRTERDLSPAVLKEQFQPKVNHLFCQVLSILVHLKLIFKYEIPNLISI